MGYFSEMKESFLDLKDKYQDVKDKVEVVKFETYKAKKTGLSIQRSLKEFELVSEGYLNKIQEITRKYQNDQNLDQPQDDPPASSQKKSLPTQVQIPVSDETQVEVPPVKQEKATKFKKGPYRGAHEPVKKR